MAAAKLTLLIVAASYPLAAALLWVAKARGATVPWYWPTAWLACGVIGGACAWFLADGRPLAWVGVALFLGVLMAVSLVVDVRGGHWIIAAIDVAGLIAIAWALWASRAALA